ncbi:uncharacterized protein [Pseudorasbora parva]|uniref:uncharacterized protein n=1 Tax=Pseudorasbora parva TaxID=51549 RepID=UPI00351DD846
MIPCGCGLGSGSGLIAERWSCRMEEITAASCNMVPPENESENKGVKMKKNSQMVFANEGEKGKRKNRREKEHLDLSAFKKEKRFNHLAGMGCAVHNSCFSLQSLWQINRATEECDLAAVVHSAWKRERGGQRNQRTCPPARFTTWLKNNVFACLITRSWERERETREKDRVEGARERVQRLAVLVIWLKCSNKIPTSYFSRFPGAGTSVDGPKQETGILKINGNKRLCWGKFRGRGTEMEHHLFAEVLIQVRKRPLCLINQQILQSSQLLLLTLDILSNKLELPCQIHGRTR